MWYGVSSIAARFINYLLTPYLTFKLTESQYGEQSIIYAFIPFMNVVFTYGMETTFFRFANKADKKEVYNTASISLLISTMILGLMMIGGRHSLATLLQINQHPEYLTLTAAVISFDALSAIPFAKLRQDGRPLKFASVKVASILIYIAFTYFFLSLCPNWIKQDPNHWCSLFYKPNWIIGYMLVANLIQSTITLLLLSGVFWGFEWKFNYQLWLQMIIYSLPLMVAGFAGMINETFDRIMLGWWAPVNMGHTAKEQVGIYSACYKLSLLISLSIQAFRMGAEPFFFKQAAEANATKVYARVMKFFVITLCVMFLCVALYLDIWKLFIRNKDMYQGLKVVPILLLANMFLGIYINLSVWYKLTHKTMVGVWITLIGAGITLLINYFLIPYFGYMASAWATFACYGSMMVVSFIWGQKEYRIPYAWKKLLAYMVIAVLLYFIHSGLLLLIHSMYFSLFVATLLLVSYLLFVMNIEKKEIQKIPILKRLVR